MRDILVAGNWKMHGNTAFNTTLVAGLVEKLRPCRGVAVLLCPPFPYLAAIAQRLADTTIQLGAQTVSAFESGAHTGEVAAGMLRDLGCDYVLVGHSERRTLYGESDEQVAGKFAAATAAGLKPILCVGESLAERQAGQAQAVIDRQVTAIIERLGVDGFDAAAIAYEPVWAIGTGLTATPQQAQEIHAHIRETLADQSEQIAADLQILYGGSVNADNAAGLFSMPDIDGGLIGGASLDAGKFAAIVEAAGHVTTMAATARV